MKNSFVVQPSTLLRATARGKTVARSALAGCAGGYRARRAK